MDAADTQGPPGFPMPRDHPFDIAPEYSQLRETQPIARVRMPSGKNAWLITKYEYVRQVLSHPQVSVDRRHPGYPARMAGSDGEAQGGLMSMDPPDHTTHRRLLIPDFTVKQVLGLLPRTREIVADGIRDLRAGDRPADLLAAFALPVVSRLFCEILGVRQAEHGFVQSQLRILHKRDVTEAEKRAVAVELPAFYRQLVVRYEDVPGDALLSRLIARYREAGRYDRELIARMAGGFLISADATASLIALGVVALLAHPDQLAKLRRDPGLAASAADELLRYFSPTAEASGFRVALADIEIDGFVIRAGDGIIALGSAANRDAEAFGDPDAFDIERRARHHVAFGFGVHQCLGQNLVRMVLSAALTAVFGELPGLCVAVPFAELSFHGPGGPYGLHELPVTW
jgi:cytochrome P450